MLTQKSIWNREDGFALETALLLLVLMITLVGGLLAAASSSLRSTVMSVGNSRTFYAAEAGAESALAQLAVALQDGNLEDQELALIAAPSLAGFSFDSFAVRKVGSSVVEPVTDGPYAGLYSLTQRVEVLSEAVDPPGNSNAVIVSAKAQAIPIFQFGVFYDEDLEITNGPPMTFVGRVHTNGNLYLSSNNAWYEEQITTPGKVFWDRKDAHDVKSGVYIHDAAADDIQLDFDSRSHPDPNAFRAESDAKFDSRLKTDAFGVDTLNLPLPDGVTAHELIRPREGTDSPSEQQGKFAWKADWVIRINLSTLPASPLADPTATCAQITHLRSPGLSAPGNSECGDFLSFQWERFFESREGRYVDALEIEMDKFFAWAGGSPDRATSILYVEFTGLGQDPSGDGVYPVVRLVDGDFLAWPFTIATDKPLYVQGDYNTAGWQPAALVGDVITFLSNSWNDANHLAPLVVRPTASNTSVYAAVLAGHSATPCDHHFPGCPGGNYGGGLENFPRFLESWGGRTFTYYGSLVSLYTGQEATAPWSYGAYYTAPNRNWNFDTRFRDPTKLPPGTPVVGSVIQTAFRPVH